MLPQIRVDDPKLARLLGHPAGRMLFAAGFGLMFFETVANFRSLVQMAGVWERNVSNPPPLPAGDDVELPLLQWDETDYVFVGADPLDLVKEVHPRGETSTVDP